MTLLWIGIAVGLVLGVAGGYAWERARLVHARWDAGRARREMDHDRDFRRHADSAMRIVHDTNPRWRRWLR